MRRLLSVGAAVVALSLVASAASASELVANGGFTTGDFTGWTTFSANGGNLGYSVDPRVVSFDVTGGGASDAAEFQVGSNAPGNQEGGGISQAIHTVGGELDFTADWALIGGTAGENGSGGVFSVLLDGVTLDSFNTGDVPGFPNVVRGSLAFGATVTAGTHILALQITRPYTVGFSDGYTPVQYFDDVSAVQAGGAVPEPQTWALMLGGFGLAGAALRRRRAPLAA